MESRNRIQPCWIDSVFFKTLDPLASQFTRSEVKITRTTIEHNLSMAVGDHLGHLFKDIFHDLKEVKNYACGKTKANCILKRANNLNLEKHVIKYVKQNCFRISMDGNNDQGIININSVKSRVDSLISTSTKLSHSFMIYVCQLLQLQREYLPPSLMNIKKTKFLGRNTYIVK